ncbi:hypothetical protein DPX16_2347 [Anabarilius grahami]|uniref:Uncharacterized protein n=1 Tax=Anabarilius grahami TaxID=495550 RepID=A0A3N0YGN2_ANAGA|nr:hypothetical protein DPX16_2347 [Anabarilius grahami]
MSCNKQAQTNQHVPPTRLCFLPPRPPGASASERHDGCLFLSGLIHFAAAARYQDAPEMIYSWPVLIRLAAGSREADGPTHWSQAGRRSEPKRGRGEQRLSCRLPDLGPICPNLASEDSVEYTALQKPERFPFDLGIKKFIRANLWTITAVLKLCLVYRSNIYRACLSLVSSHDPAIPAPSLNIQGFQRMRIMRIPVKARTISFIHPGSSKHSREDSSQRETALQKLPETINSPAPGVRSLWRRFTAVITVEKVPPFVSST